MITLKQTPREIISLKNLWDSKRKTWLEKAHKSFERYNKDVEGTGTDYTREQLERIERNSQVPISISKVHPQLRQYLALLMNNKPSFKVTSLDDRGKEYSEVLDKAIKSIMYNSEAQGEEEETIKSMLITGIGISFVRESYDYQFGNFNIEYENLDPDLVILDSNSKKRSMKDMQGFFINKEITEYEANKKYKVVLDKINEIRLSNNEEPIDWSFFSFKGDTTEPKARVETDWFNNKIEVTEYYDKVLTTMYLIDDGKGIRRVFKENLDEGAEFIISAAEQKELNSFVRKFTMFGDYLVAIEILPIRDFPLKVKYYDWGGSPYTSYGLIHHIIQMQETLDKAVQLMITNGILTNNAGYISPQGGIPPEEESKWETLGNKPGIIKKFVPTVIDGQVFVPRREEIQQLSNFYPMLIQMMDSSIKESTGINASVTGNAQEAGIDVFSTLKQYQDAAMQQIKLTMSHINLANQQLGNVVIDYLLANLNSEQAYLFFDETNKKQELTLLKENMKNIQFSRFMVLSVASEAMPTQRLSMANSLMQIAQTTPDPFERTIYIQKAFELSDMRGFDEVKETIDTTKRLQAQIAQLEEEIKRNKELIKQYENKALNAEYKARVMEEVAQAEAELKEAKMKNKLAIEKEKFKKQLEEQKKDLTNNKI